MSDYSIVNLMDIENSAKELKLWDVIRVAPETIRSFEAGPDGLDIIAVGGPKPEGATA